MCKVILLFHNFIVHLFKQLKNFHEILVYLFSVKKTKSKILLPNIQSRDEELLQIETTDHPRRAVGEKVC